MNFFSQAALLNSARVLVAIRLQRQTAKWFANDVYNTQSISKFANEKTTNIQKYV